MGVVVENASNLDKAFVVGRERSCYCVGVAEDSVMTWKLNIVPPDFFILMHLIGTINRSIVDETLRKSVWR